MDYYFTYHDVSIRLDPHAIHITNNKAFSDYIWQWGHNIGPLVQDCKSRFKMENRRNFTVSDDSLVVEILAHFHADGLLSLAETGVLVARGIPSDLIASLIRVLRVIAASHTGVIDCGEKGYDGDRPLWDALAPFRGIIETVLVD